MDKNLNPTNEEIHSISLKDSNLVDFACATKCIRIKFSIVLKKKFIVYLLTINLMNN